MLSHVRHMANPGYRRGLASAASPPFMWKVAHGMFDPEIPMTRRLPNIESPDPVAASPPGAVQVSTLSNGVRVASQELDGPVSAVGVFVGAGSRDETPFTSGTTHFLEHIAFKGSHARSKYRMVRDCEKTGATFAAAAGRETLAFTSECMRRDAAEVIEILAESATAPATAIASDADINWNSAQSEITSHVNAIKEELSALDADPSGRVTEAIHAAAFHGNTLGRLKESTRREGEARRGRMRNAKREARVFGRPVVL